MKLILNKSQQAKGLTGSKIVYTLDIKADLTEDELNNIARYKMANEVLYSDAEGDVTESIWKSLKVIATSTVIRVSDLTNGKAIQCDSFMEIMAVQQQVKTACSNLKSLLEAMANFEGEEILEI